MDPVRAVPPPLRPYVTALVAYDVALGAPGVHVGMPGTTLTFVLPLDAPLDVGWSGEPASRAVRWSTVSGLHTGPAAIHHHGHQRGVQLALTTAGARALFGLPAAALAGELLELADAAPALRHLPEQVAEAATTPAAAARIEATLIAALAGAEAPRPRPEVGHALARLTRGATVQQTADEVGYSRRHLGTLVRAEAGVGPKTFHRLARFERSHRLLRREALRGRRVGLAGVAADAGYADQAHLSREWVALAGCSPTSWLREELPFVQDVDARAAAG